MGGLLSRNAVRRQGLNDLEAEVGGFMLEGVGSRAMSRLVFPRPFRFRIRSRRAQKLPLGGLESYATGGGSRLRFYTLLWLSGIVGIWNCWNSTAVMFELRCSKSELGCSESAGNKRTWFALRMIRKI